jgi:hypothetical protein
MLILYIEPTRFGHGKLNAKKLRIEATHMIRAAPTDVVMELERAGSIG